MNNRGQKGEELAERYLIEHGYKIMEKNWRGNKNIKSPEIDLIVQKDNVVVFVEVKSCKGGQFGNPEYWITPAKQKRLSKGANAYLAINHNAEAEYRFDAIIVDRTKNRPLINHIENAFAFIEDEIRD
jgi:putative endonuclease